MGDQLSDELKKALQQANTLSKFQFGFEGLFIRVMIGLIQSNKRRPIQESDSNT